jgi:hypothetical protein
MFSLLPLFISGLKADSPEGGNYLVLAASADTTGMWLGTIFAYYGVRLAHWRLITFLLAFLQLFANVCSVNLDLGWLFVLFRLLCGFGGGWLMSLALVTVQARPAQDRSLAILLFAQTLLGAGLAWIASPYLAEFGASTIVVINAAALALLLPFAWFLRRYAAVSIPDVGYAQPISTKRALELVSMFLFNASVFAAWSQIAVIGRAYGADVTTSARVTSFGVLAMGLGALLAALISGRLPVERAAKIGWGLLLLSIAVLMWRNGHALGVYVSGAILLALCWNFVLPFLGASLAASDKTGRILIIFIIVAKAAYSAAPAASTAILERFGVFTLLLVALVGASVSFALWVFTLNIKGELPAPATSEQR